MNKSHIDKDWKFENNSKAPLFPVWFCFKSNGEFHDFKICEGIEKIENTILNSSSTPDFAERIIDNKGDIYNIILNSDQKPIPQFTERLTVHLLMNIIQHTEVEELEKFIAIDEIESFIVINELEA